MAESEVKSILVQAFPVLMLCSFLSFGSGSFLGYMGDSFRLLPGLIIMVPPLLALRGNVSGILASRLGSALHQGVIEPRLSWTSEIVTNVLSAIFLSLFGSFIIGMLSYSISFLTGIVPVSAHVLLLIAVVAGLLSSVIQSGLTVLIAILSYTKGLDPDNVTAPLMMSIGDLLTVSCIFVAIFLVV